MDASSLDAIVADLIHAGISDEEMALTLYRFWTRTVYHYGWLYMVPSEAVTSP